MHHTYQAYIQHDNYIHPDMALIRSFSDNHLRHHQTHPVYPNVYRQRPNAYQLRLNVYRLHPNAYRLRPNPMNLDAFIPAYNRSHHLQYPNPMNLDAFISAYNRFHHLQYQNPVIRNLFSMTPSRFYYYQGLHPSYHRLHHQQQSNRNRRQQRTRRLNRVSRFTSVSNPPQNDTQEQQPPSQQPPVEQVRIQQRIIQPRPFEQPHNSGFFLAEQAQLYELRNQQYPAQQSSDQLPLIHQLNISRNTCTLQHQRYESSASQLFVHYPRIQLPNNSENVQQSYARRPNNSTPVHQLLMQQPFIQQPPTQQPIAHQPTDQLPFIHQLNISRNTCTPQHPRYESSASQLLVHYPRIQLLNNSENVQQSYARQPSNSTPVHQFLMQQSPSQQSITQQATAQQPNYSENSWTSMGQDHGYDTWHLELLEIECELRDTNPFYNSFLQSP